MADINEFDKTITRAKKSFLFNLFRLNWLCLNAFIIMYPNTLTIQSNSLPISNDDIKAVSVFLGLTV